MKRLLIVVFAALLLAAAQMRAQGTPALEKLFASAQHKATVEGDLKGAIEDYKQIVATAGKDRSTAGRALLRMAEAYQKLGDAEAQKIYQRLVREFSDQKDVIAIAQSRLEPNPLERKRADRIVQAGAGTVGEGDVSPDGRFISFVSWGGPKGLNLMLRDLVANADRALTDVDWNSAEAEESTFSPDGKQLAYSWLTNESSARAAELRVMTLDGTDAPRVRTIFANEDITGFAPTDWSRDGRTLAVRVTRKDQSNQIALIGLDGSFRALKTVEGWRAARKIFFSPDGKYVAYNLPASDTDPRRDLFITATDASGETPIHDPADEVVMGWSPDGRHLLFASDRNGHIDLWALPVSNGKPTGGAPSLVKRDIGTVASLGLTASGTLYTVKDVSTVGIQVAPIDLKQGKLTGSPVLQVFRTETPAWSPDGKFLAYSARSANGQSYLAIRETATNRVREFHPPLEYTPQPQWFPDGKSVLLPGRDIRRRWKVLRIEVETGRETLIETEAAGQFGQFVQVSRDGRKLYFQIDTVGPTRSGKVMEHDLESGAKREVLVKPQGTGAAHLSPDGTAFALVRSPEIDSQNPKAKTSTLFIISTAGGTSREVSVPAMLETYRGITWTPDGQSLLVGTVRPDAPQLWLVPVNGGSPRKLDIDVTTWNTARGIRLHPSGNQIAFFSGQGGSEVWALDNVVPGATK